MSTETIKVLLVQAHEKPVTIEIPNNLKGFQQAVGGYIEFYDKLHFPGGSPLHGCLYLRQYRRNPQLRLTSQVLQRLQ